MIELRQITKVYPGDQQAVLDQVDFTLERGQFLYVLGGTGAGKSSLMKLLSLDEDPSSGSLSLFGKECSKRDFDTKRKMKNLMGVVPQALSVIPEYSVWENLELGRMTSRSPMSKKDSEECLEHLGLMKKKNHLASTLSGGEVQRLVFARAVVRRPELLLLDEPTGSQDREYAWTMMDILLKLHRVGATILLATHDQEILQKIKRPVSVLKNAKLQKIESGIR